MYERMIAFDIDGVLANFTRGFTRIAHRLYGSPVGDGASQETWFFEDYPQLGLNKEQCDFSTGAIWQEIKSSPFFWAELDALNPSVMPRIDAIKNKLFITNRAGVDPIGQSEQFLELHGILNPVVFLAAKKAPIVAQYHVVAMVDDYYPNVVEVKEVLPAGYVALHYTNYNRMHHETWLANGGEITLSVDHFIDECERRGYIEYGD
jgi:hypothetical protein